MIHGSLDSADLSFGGKHYNNIVKKSNGLLYTKYINRPLAWLFTRVLYRFSPNTISTTAFFVLLTGLLSLYDVTSITSAVILYFIVSLNYVLDSSDGQVARLTGRGSPLGEWLDHSFDAIRLILVNVFLILFIIENTTVDYYLSLLFLPLVGQVGLYTVGLLRDKVLKLNISKEVRNSKFFGSIAQFCLLPADYGFFITLFVFTAWPDLLLYLYLGFGCYYILLLLVTMIYIFLSESKRMANQ